MPFLSRLFCRLLRGPWSVVRNKRQWTTGHGRPTNLEALENRTLLSSASVVPLSQAIDNKTTFFRVADALSVATNPGDVITIDPGVAADPGPVQVTSNGIAIQANASTLASSLPIYNFILNASHVTLSRLNLDSVVINPDFSNDAVVGSNVNNIAILGGQTGAGGNIIDQDVITGSVVMTGLLTSPQVGNRITNSTFKSLTPNTTNAIIAVEDNNGVVIQNNVITGQAAIAQDGISITRGMNLVIGNNSISLNGTDVTTRGIIVQNPGGGPLMTATITNNRVSTNGGVGLFLNAFNDPTLQALVQGNDFHGNAIGLDYLGSNGPSIGSDLGGGSNSLGSSLGGNDFRGFPANASKSAAAIRLSGAGAGAILAAGKNIFDDPATAAGTLFVDGSASVDVGQPLSNKLAFVQTLYNNLLGRTGTLAELDSWAKMLTGSPSARSNVVMGILRSDASLTRIVDGYYLKYLERSADSAGEAYWVGMLKSGASLETVQAGFMSSSEFRSNNAGAVVQGLYRAFFDRTASAPELTFWYNALQQPNGLAMTAQAFAASAENRALFVESCFANLLRRTPSSAEWTYFLNQPKGLLSLQGQILAAPEFSKRG